MGKFFWMAMAFYLLYRYVTKPSFVVPSPPPKPPPPPASKIGEYVDYEEIK